MKPRTIECEQNEWKTKLENGGYQTLKLLWIWITIFTRGVSLCTYISEDAIPLPRFPSILRSTRYVYCCSESGQDRRGQEGAGQDSARQSGQGRTGQSTAQQGKARHFSFLRAANLGFFPFFPLFFFSDSDIGSKLSAVYFLISASFAWERDCAVRRERGGWRGGRGGMCGWEISLWFVCSTRTDLSTLMLDMHDGFDPFPNSTYNSLVQ